MFSNVQRRSCRSSGGSALENKPLQVYMFPLSLSIPFSLLQHPMCNTCCTFFIGWVAKKDKMEPPANHRSVECFSCSNVRSIPTCCSWTCNRQHPSAFEAWILLQPSNKAYQEHHAKISTHTHTSIRNVVSATRSEIAPKVFRRSNSDMLDVCLCLQGPINICTCMHKTARQKLRFAHATYTAQIC